jgi:hypothetical protein
MTTLIANPSELRRRGFESLAATLGWVNAVRFLQQYEYGSGDYAHDRDRFLPDWDPEQLLKMSHQRDQSSR